MTRIHQAIAVEIVAVRSLGAAHATTHHRVFRPLFEHRADSLLLAHKPDRSDDDRSLTENLARAGGHLGIQVLDHLVIGAEGRYFSFAQAGALRSVG